MKTEVTQQQIDAYQRDGFLIIEDFISEAEVEEILAAVEESVAQMGKQKVAGDGNEDLAEGDSFYDRVFLQRLNLWRINDTIKRYFLNPNLGKMLAKLAGVEGIHVWDDQTLQKAPWANPTAWRLDNPYSSFHSRDALSIWVALDGATIQNGCMYYLPGTHKTANFDNVDIDENVGTLFDVYLEWCEIEPVMAEMKRGWAGVHNGPTAHGAGPNMTPRPRRAMTCAYMPQGAKFNGQQNILPKEFIDSLKIGDPLVNEKLLPLIWSKSRAAG